MPAMVSVGPTAKAAEAEFHISTQAALIAQRQALAAPFGRAGEPVPAGGGPGGVGLLPAGRHGDVAVLEQRAVLIADAVERRDHVGGELAGFLEHRVDEIVAEVLIDPLGPRRREPGGIFQGKRDIGDRRAVHERSPANAHSSSAPVRGKGEGGALRAGGIER